MRKDRLEQSDLKLELLGQMNMRPSLHSSDIHYCARILAPILGASEQPDALLNQILMATARELQTNDQLAIEYLKRRDLADFERAISVSAAGTAN